MKLLTVFLAELGINDSDNLSVQETDLSQSGQVMLWASKLVLLKAETLARISELNPEDEESAETNIEDNLELETKRYQINELDKKKLKEEHLLYLLPKEK